MKRFYEFTYRYFRPPWDVGEREELMSLVENGCIKPGCAIDLGNGAGANAIPLAQRGFEMTGVDFAEAAIEKAWGTMLAKLNSVLLIVTVPSMAVARFM